MNFLKPKTPKKDENNSPRLPKDDRNFDEFLYYKKVIEKKLTIIFIENTTKVYNQKETINMIVNNLVTSGLICVINYGAKIRQSEICEIYDFESKFLLCDEEIVNTGCLYDALIELSSLISAKYMNTTEKYNELIKINKIEIIGIGTCEDNGSKSSKDDAIVSFCNSVKRPNITNKYFCLTEQNFINAAEIGFRSIGAISRNY